MWYTDGILYSGGIFLFSFSIVVIMSLFDGLAAVFFFSSGEKLIAPSVIPSDNILLLFSRIKTHFVPE